MPFSLVWTKAAEETYNDLKASAQASLRGRQRNRKTKASQVEGLFKQVHKTVQHLSNNPRHPGLQTHVYRSLENPYDKNAKVYEAYVQHRTPGAYRMFWCYGPGKNEITIIAITPHP